MRTMTKTSGLDERAIQSLLEANEKEPGTFGRLLIGSLERGLEKDFTPEQASSITTALLYTALWRDYLVEAWHEQATQMSAKEESDS